MRRMLLAGLVGVVALAVVGVAAATFGATNVREASATFSATTVEKYESWTCTDAQGGTVTSFAGRYVGSADGSDDAFKGPVVLRVRGTVNAQGLGVVDGWIRFKQGEDERRGHGNFTAILSGGALDGFVAGHAHRSHGRIFGNLVGTFDPAKGLTDGKLGGGATGAGLAVLAEHGSCDNKRKGTAVKVEVRGAVEAIDVDKGKTITVKPQDGSASVSCTIADERPRLDRIAVGDTVKMECKSRDGVLTLTKIEKRGGDDSAKKSDSSQKDDDKDDDKD